MLTAKIGIIKAYHVSQRVKGSPRPKSKYFLLGGGPSEDSHLRACFRFVCLFVSLNPARLTLVDKVQPPSFLSVAAVNPARHCDDRRFAVSVLRQDSLKLAAAFAGLTKLTDGAPVTLVHLGIPRGAPSLCVER